jgi:hypothetical protein
MLVGCVATEHERVKLDQSSEDRGCKQANLLEIAPGWPTSKLRTYAAVRCETVTTEKWKVTRRTTLPILVTGALAVAGGLATALTGVGGVAVANRNNHDYNARSAVDVEVQVAFWTGMLLGAGLNLGIILGLESLTDKTQEELHPTTVAFNRDVVPIDVEVRVSSDAPPLATVNGQLEVEDAALVKLRATELRVNGEPPVLTEEMRAKLEAAQGCAITFAKPDVAPGTLSDAELTLAVSAAHRCLDIGVWDADPKHTALLAEQKRRR